MARLLSTLLSTFSASWNKSVSIVIFLLVGADYILENWILGTVSTVFYKNANFSWFLVFFCAYQTSSEKWVIFKGNT